MLEHEAIPPRPVRRPWRTLLALLLVWAVALAAAACYTPPGLLSSEVVAIPEMLGQRTAWEGRGGLTLLFLGTATLVFAVVLVMRPRRPFTALGASIACVLAAFLTVRALATDERESQSCANCRTFIAYLLEDYAKRNDGWLPRGEDDELAALAKAIPDEHSVHFFTSHASAAAAHSAWESSRTLSPESCLYRYNQGLRLDDPPGLVVLYTARPSTWECSHHPRSAPGRACYLHPGKSFDAHTWEFLPEAQFEAEQQRTLAHIAARSSREGVVEELRSSLLLRVAHKAKGSNRHAFTVRLENRGERAVSIRTLARGSLEVAKVGAQGQFCDRDETIQLPPGGQMLFPWWFELELELTVRGGTVVGYRRTDRDPTVRGQGEGTLELPLAEARDRILAEAMLYAEATRDGGRPVPLTLRSPGMVFLD